MAKTHSGGTPLGTGFKLNDPQPIVDYMVVDFVDDLDTLPNQFIGMKVFVIEDDTDYTLKSTGWQPEFDAETQNENDVIAITSLELVSNTITLGAGSSWIIQGMTYTNPADYGLNIPNASTGFKRKDRVLLDQDNKIVLLQGDEHATKPYLKPYNRNLFIEVSQIDVNGSTIGVLPAELGAYVKKNEFGLNLMSTSNSSEIIIINEKSGYVLSGSQEVINFIADFPNNSPLFDGKEFFIYNNQSIPITLKNEYSTSSTTARKFKFKDNIDYVLEPQTGVKVKWIAYLNRLVVVSSSEKIDVLKNQLTKSGNQTLDNTYNGKVITFTGSGTFTVNNTIAEQGSFALKVETGVTVAWAITSPATWRVGGLTVGTAPRTLEGGDMVYVARKGSSNEIEVYGI